jgi:hypothetical protein
VDAFREYDRKDRFSIAALHTLFDYLYEDSNEYKLDVVALCYAFTEYDNKIDAAMAYGWCDDDPTDYEGTPESRAMQFLTDNTVVILTLGEFIACYSEFLIQQPIETRQR